MTCQLTFLPVGNADSIVIQGESSLVVVDLGKPRVLEKWLRDHNKTKISRIYITHAHGDHFPSLVKLVEFLDIWLKQGILEKFHLPYRVYESALRKLSTNRNSSPAHRRLELAVNRIYEWDVDGVVNFSPVVRDVGEYSEGLLEIKVLHPSQIYVERHLVSSSSRLNEISIVLQINYGDFSSLLLADIEGAGLAEFLKFLKAVSTSSNFQANLTKIPHHGAWPVNGNDLTELFALIDAEIAVLSVGSKNPYGHVEPRLFKALIDLKNDDSKRLKQFICTEVTRTCVHSASDCSTMNSSGLSQRQLCAGEITIIAEASGKWKLGTETNHPNVVSSFSYAACEGRVDLSNLT